MAKVEIGYKLSSEDHGAMDLVRYARRAEAVVCGPDPDRHIAAIEAFIDAGFNHICVHQGGPDQEGFFRFYEREVLPKLR